MHILCRNEKCLQRAQYGAYVVVVGCKQVLYCNVDRDAQTVSLMGIFIVKCSQCSNSWEVTLETEPQKLEGAYLTNAY